MWNSGPVSFILNAILFVTGIFEHVDRDDLDFTAIMGGVIQRGEEGGRMYLNIIHIFDFCCQKNELSYWVTQLLANLVVYNVGRNTTGETKQVNNPNRQKADQFAIYKHSRGVEPRTS